MKRKSLTLLVTLFIVAFMSVVISSCGSDDNADFNIYFVGVGTNTSQTYYDNKPLQKIVTDDISKLNQVWQITIMNEKEAKEGFDNFSKELDKKLKTQVTEGKLTINEETYFTLVLSHSVKHGQEYPVISTYKVEL